MPRSNSRVQTKGLALDTGIFIAMRTLQLRPRLRQHGVLVGKNCCGTNEIKSLQTSSFPSYYVRARKEGGMSSPLGLFSAIAIVGAFYHWNTQTMMFSLLFPEQQILLG